MTTLEREWLASGLPVAALMEKVGLAMAAWFLARPELLREGVLVLVGPGHNGGDGLVVARELAQAGVAVRLWAPLPIRQPLTEQHWSHARWLGLPVLEADPDPSDPMLWIEALFGLGQHRPLPEPLAVLFREREQHRPGRLVSLDVPAGLDGDTGIPHSGDAAVAMATLTVALIKKGLVQDSALAHVGTLHRLDAGIPNRLLPDGSSAECLGLMPSDLNALSWPQPSRRAMKYERGRVLLVVGSDRYRGAALLALRGALASGAGSVQAIVPESIAPSLWQQVPEVVLATAVLSTAAVPSTAAVADQADGGSAADGGMAWADALARQDIGRLDALLIGPGLGSACSPWDRAAAPLLAFPGVLVLDADALNQLALSDQGWRWLQRRRAVTWITPHAGEFRRLFPQIDLANPLLAAKEAAACSGAVVLLKGAHSVIAAPDGSVRQLVETDAHVARTGLGDVLAGLAAGWAAQGPVMEWQAEPLAAAALMHATAAARCRGSSAAGDVAASLARLIRQLQSQ
jgi:hydroxyethylthiazole kinase-like uncharacterized protein yjeF